MTTLVVNPSQSADSAEQNSSGTVTLGTAVAAFSASEPYVGTRFENITIGAGSTISTATYSLYGEGKALAITSAILVGVKMANPGVFTTTTSSVSTLYSGSPTTNTYTWTATLSTSAYTATGSIAAIITELIGQGSWASGNAMQFVLYYGSSNAGFYQYGEGTGKWEQLSITYTAGAVSYVPPRVAQGQAVNRASTY